MQIFTTACCIDLAEASLSNQKKKKSQKHCANYVWLGKSTERERKREARSNIPILTKKNHSCPPPYVPLKVPYGRHANQAKGVSRLRIPDGSISGDTSALHRIDNLLC